MSAPSASGRGGALFAWPAAHPVIALLLTAVGAFAAVLATRDLKADSSLQAMFAKNDPSAIALARVLDQFSAADDLLLLVSLPNGAASDTPDVSRLTSFADRLDAALKSAPETHDLSDGVIYRADTETREFFERVLAPSALFYLDEPTYQAARRRLTKEEMRRQIRQDEAMMSMPGPAAAAMAKALMLDPLRLHEFIMDRLAAQQPFKTYQNSDAFLTQDGRSLLIRVPGKRPPSDLEFCTKLTEGVAAVASRVNSDALQIEYTGSYAIAAEAGRSIRRDMIGSVVGSVICMQALFLLAYRSPFKMFAFAFGPVALGVLFGFGLYALTGRGLTPLTAVLGAILAGMGIDYSIQYLSYYENRRSGGLIPRDAAVCASRDVSPAILAAWATSVMGFVAIGFSRVQALRDFSILGSLGLAGALVCAVCVLPAMLVLSDRRPTPIDRSRIRFGAARLLERIYIHRTRALAASMALLLAALGIIALARGNVMPLESDLTVMHPHPNPPLAAQAHLAERFGASAGSLLIYLKADSPGALVARAQAVQQRLGSPAAHDAGISGAYGLASLLPDAAIVEARVKDVSAADAERVVADFHDVIADSIFDPKACEPYATFLKLLLTQRNPPTVASLLPYHRLAEMMLPRSAVARGERPTEAITLVFVRDPLEERAPRDAAVNTVRQLLADVPGATLTGLGVISYDTEQTVRNELPRLILVALGAVAAYLIVHFRNVADAVLALAPTVFSLAVLAAVVYLAGQKLNMINLVAIPLLIGIDVDYGIFLVSLARVRRVKRETAAELIHRIDPVVHAVILCATATILGFGSLMGTSVPAVRSLGFAVAVGIAACVAGVLFISIPFLLRLTRSR